MEEGHNGEETKGYSDTRIQGERNTVKKSNGTNSDCITQVLGPKLYTELGPRWIQSISRNVRLDIVPSPSNFFI